MPVRPITTGLVISALLTLGTRPPASASGSGDDPDPPALALTDPIALTKQAAGYRDYEELDPVERTEGQTLWIYLEPTDYTIRSAKGVHESHLVEDVEVRKVGASKAIWSKKALVEYHPTGPDRPSTIYLLSSVELKDLKPGHYEAELTVHDRLRKDVSALATLNFEVLEAKQDDPR